METFDLSDLVMLQMVGGLDSAISALVTGQAVAPILTERRALSTTPHLFKEIVRKTIETQFAEAIIVVRELAQNAIDSYDVDSSGKNVEFKIEERPGGLILEVRDYGIGMQLEEVIRNLLIPYNSGKELDHTKIGEHGIGWFSAMDVSDRIEVFTKNGDGPATYVDLRKDVSDWGVSIEQIQTEFKGTSVRIHMDRPYVSKGDVKSGLERYLGLVDSLEADVTLDGEKINILAQEYRQVGEATIHSNGRDGKVRLMMSAKMDFWRSDMNMQLTQHGLYIKGMRLPFSYNTLHKDFFNKLTNSGYQFWADLPCNIGLTKGRNSIASGDSQNVTAALYEAFEQAVLEVILNDAEMVEELDTQLSVMIREILSNKYMELLEEIIPKVQFRERIRKIFSRNRNASRNSGFAGRDYFKSEEFHSTYQPIGKLDRKAEKRIKEYLTKAAGMSKKLITKEFIPAVQKTGATTNNVKVSIINIIGAYELENLHFMHEGDELKENGLYVNAGNQIIQTIVANLRVMEAARKFIPDPSPHDFTLRLQKDKAREIPHFLRTGRTTFEKITSNENVGWEYLGLLDILIHLDGLVSEANNLPQSPLAIHNHPPRILGEIDLAHTDYRGISFNAHSGAVKEYLGKIRDGEVQPYTLDSLLEVLLHEKAHIVMGSITKHTAHGKEFYSTKKKELRDNLLTYLMENRIDPLEGVNGIVAALPETEQINVLEMASLINKYTGRVKRFASKLRNTLGGQDI